MGETRGKTADLLQPIRTLGQKMQKVQACAGIVSETPQLGMGGYSIHQPFWATAQPSQRALLWIDWSLVLCQPSRVEPAINREWREPVDQGVRRSYVA